MVGSLGTAARGRGLWRVIMGLDRRWTSSMRPVTVSSHATGTLSEGRGDINIRVKSSVVMVDFPTTKGPLIILVTCK